MTLIHALISHHVFAVVKESSTEYLCMPYNAKTKREWCGCRIFKADVALHPTAWRVQHVPSLP